MNDQNPTITANLMTQQPYDIIGDIHGHADELERLLAKLGYSSANGTYRHPAGRKVIFLGDYIDRGPAIFRVLDIVRRMVNEQEALAILGNHEVNALRYHGIDEATLLPLREHNDGNTNQHWATLDQIDERHPDEWKDHLEWFAGLPLWLDLGAIRIVHAAWDAAAIESMREMGRLDGETLARYSRKKTPDYETISQLINGPEALLPEGYSHRTADGTDRREIRVKWWRSLSGATCREAIFPDSWCAPELPAEKLPPTGYPDDSPPTFFGHYALKDPIPHPLAANLACLDYGIGKGGFLCAYRWDGERRIDAAKFIAATNLENGGK